MKTIKLILKCNRMCFYFKSLKRRCRCFWKVFLWTPPPYLGFALDPLRATSLAPDYGLQKIFSIGNPPLNLALCNGRLHLELGNWVRTWFQVTSPSVPVLSLIYTQQNFLVFTQYNVILYQISTCICLAVTGSGLEEFRLELSGWWK